MKDGQSRWTVPASPCARQPLPPGLQHPTALTLDSLAPLSPQYQLSPDPSPAPARPWKGTETPGLQDTRPSKAFIDPFSLLSVSMSPTQRARIMGTISALPFLWLTESRVPARPPGASVSLQTMAFRRILTS